MAINLADYPPYSTVTLANPPDGVKNINVQDYDAERDGEIIVVLRPENRAAMAAAK